MLSDNDVESCEDACDASSTDYEMELDGDTNSDVCMMTIDELKAFVRTQFYEQRKTFNCDINMKLEALVSE